MDNVQGNAYARTPKNKKQIGKIGKGDKIYIEDYAVTYLNQVARTSEDENGFAGLFGTCREVEGVKEYYIYAAIYQPAEKILEGGLPRETVQKIMRKRAELFTEYFFLGWALILKENSGTMWESCYRSRLETLMGKPEVLMTIHKNSCEEHFYLYPTEMPKETEGYFIFYEQNDTMQNFLIDWHGTNHTDKCDGDSDRLAESCRNYYKEKKADRFRNRLAAVALIAAVLLLIFTAGVGINNLNGYAKMQEAQQTVGQVVQENQEDVLELPEYISEEEQFEMISEEITVSEESESADKVEATETIVNMSEIETEPESEVYVTEPEISTEDTSEIMEDTEQNMLQEVESVSPTDNGSLEGAEETIAEVVLQEPAEEYMVYEVAKGDTLYDICIDFYGNLKRAQEICALNNIENMDNILYGEKILLPQ